MSKNIRTQTGKIIGKTLNTYHSKLKPKVDDLKFKEQYQGRIIDCMVGEIDDNYIETPETNSAIVKLEHSKEGLVKVPSIKGKTILIDVEGNETDTPAEGCRLVSVGESEDNKLIILSKNKNLFNKDDKTYYGYYQNYNGNYWEFSPNSNHNGFMIPVEPNTQYTFNKQINCVEYNKDKETLRILRNTKFTTSENTYYIGFSRGVNEDLSDLQFEMNNTSTVYEPYRYHKTEILLDEPLRKINDNIYDEIVGNKIIRRVGRVKLTKNLTYTHNRNGNNSNEVVTCFGLRIEDKSLEGSETTVIKCNMLQQGSLGTEEEYWWAYKDTIFYFSIYNHKLKSLDVNGLKDYVDKNHLEFLYVLNEPIIEELPNSITIQGFDDATMYIENSITPTVQYGYNALIPYKEELLNQKEEVETNTLDIENNIIPYLMDMEFNLMLMEDN